MSDENGQKLDLILGIVQKLESNFEERVNHPETGLISKMVRVEERHATCREKQVFDHVDEVAKLRKADIWDAVNSAKRAKSWRAAGIAAAATMMAGFLYALIKLVFLMQTTG